MEFEIWREILGVRLMILISLIGRSGLHLSGKVLFFRWSVRVDEGQIRGGEGIERAAREMLIDAYACDGVESGIRLLCRSESLSLPVGESLALGDSLVEKDTVDS